jgi:arylsulfatase A-like enzyme
LSGYSGDQPLFLYLHTVDPHAPYEPPASYRQRFASPASSDLKLRRPPGSDVWRQLSESRQEEVLSHLLGLYDGEIAFNDFSFGELLQLLAARGLYEDAVIILISDHGEEFLGHGTWQHGRNPFAENLNIPLVIRFPDRGQGTRVAELAQHVDIMPTLLDYLGLEIPTSMQGRSLLGAVETQPSARSAEAEPPAFAYLHLDGRPHMSVIDGEWKLIQHLEQGTIAWSELYHRATDPTEARDVLLDPPSWRGIWPRCSRPG